MKVIALDTATTSCSVAVVDARRIHAEITVEPGQSHSRHLLGILDKALELSHSRVPDVAAIAASRGPGTFTGLRIGMALARGLAMASGKPLVGISSLQALAAQAAPQAAAANVTICVLLDARRNELYYGHYIVSGAALQAAAPEAVGPLAHALASIEDPCIFIGNGALRHRESIASRLGNMAHFAPSSLNIIRAATIGQLALERMAAQPPLDDGDFLPVYLRKPDAALKREGV